MSLFNQLQQYDTPATEPTLEPQQEYTVVIKQTQTGQQIMICTVEPAPQHVIDQAIAQNLPLFVPSEINNLAGANPEAVRAVIMAKLTMSGSTITKHTEDSAA